MSSRVTTSRALTIVEVLVVLVIVALLLTLLIPSVKGPPPQTDKDLDFTGWNAAAEKALRPPDDVLVSDVKLAGQWWSRRRGQMGMQIEPARDGRWPVTFYSLSGCGLGPRIELPRTATYDAGVVTFDRPVQLLTKETFQRLYTVRIDGQECLVPSIGIDKLTKTLKEKAPRDQAEALCSDLLFREAAESPHEGRRSVSRGAR